ncbi:hypothetical protein C3942_00745 [Solimonas fluminis]|uniref:HTH cro/C1-type domain-containing protein n=1 Tax=Solimonas fluminis TaxID=2086571 RepID=A0A2S5TKC7_9GAMM|nr:helix-turn-helix transcriptional regulator [Solimonas fluminis]PPE75456.1 hypothetical protein C3942_00745 [Solimonas fluminis]
MSKESGHIFEAKLRASGMKQAEFAVAMGVSAQTVVNWAKRGVSKGELIRAAKLLGCEPQELDAEYVDPIQTLKVNYQPLKPSAGSRAHQELRETFARYVAELSEADAAAVSQIIKGLGEKSAS